MRLRQIEIFYHVYRAGSISGAARDLNVSQPSVSKVLRHTEEQLGIELFLRRKGRLVATRAADELYLEAADLYARLSAFDKSLENIRGRRGGHIRLGVLPSLSLSVGPELIARMYSADARLSFEFTTLHSPEIAPSLFDKRSDLCLGYEENTDDRLVSHQVGTGRLVLVSGEMIASSPDSIDASMLSGSDFIGMRESGPIGQMIETALAERGIVPREIVTAHTYHVALSLVRKRIGIAITDQYTAFSHFGAGLHRYVLHDLPEFSIYASSLADHPDPKTVEDTVANLRSVIADLGEAIEAMQPPR